MPALCPRNSWPTLDGLWQWWRNWRSVNSRLAELQQVEEYEIQRMASDLSMSIYEFRRAAEHGTDAADLLQKRMAALNLDAKEVAATVPGTLQDLQRLCTMCSVHGKCARDLAHRPDDGAWEDYCPNAAMLKTLDALPWATRGEW